MTEQECALWELAKIIMANERAEAEAVKGYTEQLEAITRAKKLFMEDREKLELLERLEAETVEKTQDELSHGHSLYLEFSELTDIVPKED